MVLANMDLDAFLDQALLNNFVGSAAGALAGALAAFYLEARPRKTENLETQRSKLLHAQFLLAQKINSITNLKNHLDKIPPEAHSFEVPKMTHITVDERISARDIEPLIDGHWVEQATDILRFDRTYADAAEWLARFNQEKDRIAFHPDTRVIEFDLEKSKMGAAVNVPLVIELNSAWRNLRQAVDQAHESLPQAFDSLLAFMEQNYPGRRRLTLSRKKE